MNDPNEMYKNRFFNSGLFTIAKPINTKNDITPTILKIPIILFIFISFYKLMFCRVLLALPPTVFAYELKGNSELICLVKVQKFIKEINVRKATQPFLLIGNVGG